MEITTDVASCVLEVVDQGLCSGVGQPHGGQPACVAQALRRFEIGLNDACWSSDAARAKGLRRIAIAQLGTAGTLDERLFAEKVSKAVISHLLPKALRSAASALGLWHLSHQLNLLRAADRCETEGSTAAAKAAKAAYAAKAVKAAHAAAYKAAYASYAAEAAADAAKAAAYAAADAAVYAAADAAKAADELLSEFAEVVVQILVEMETPGSKFLHLTRD